MCNKLTVSIWFARHLQDKTQDQKPTIHLHGLRRCMKLWSLLKFEWNLIWLIAGFYCLTLYKCLFNGNFFSTSWASRRTILSHHILNSGNTNTCRRSIIKMNLADSNCSIYYHINSKECSTFECRHLASVRFYRRSLFITSKNDRQTCVFKCVCMAFSSTLKNGF